MCPGTDCKDGDRRVGIRAANIDDEEEGGELSMARYGLLLLSLEAPSGEEKMLGEICPKHDAHMEYPLGRYSRSQCMSWQHFG